MRRVLTHEEFLFKLSSSNKFYKEGKFKVVGKYQGTSAKILVEDSYGLCLITPSALYQGNNVSIRSAIDPHKYFLSVLEERNRFVKKGEIIILNTFKNDKTLLKVKTKFGEHIVKPYSLFSDSIPDIGTSVDKTKYLIEQFKDKHKNSYIYNKVIFLGYKKLVNIVCPIHGEFLQSPDHHLRGYGCRKCGVIKIKNFQSKNPQGWGITAWKNKAIKSINFDSFKVYILRCWNEVEEFYKVGRTFNEIKVRFRSFKSLPYNYEVVNHFEGTAEETFKLENKIKLDNKGNKYVPELIFNGMQECFKKINL